jgi:hypothetical protein
MHRVLAFLFVAGLAAAQDDPEMKRIYEEDQKPREGGVNIDWATVGKADGARREAVRKLLAEGALPSGPDFNRAAYIVQHGDKPGDYLLAHTLAMVAVKKGDDDAIWIAAATLDRYLQSIQQPQIYGTQFRMPPNEPTTQNPYDRNLISDALRKELNVPVQADQEERRKMFEAERQKK